MHPKGKIQSLNLRRKLQQRLVFVKKRVAEMPFEFQLATGKVSSLPSELKTPPKWALDASRGYWEHGIGKAFIHATPEKLREDPRGAIKELTGLYESLVAFVASPHSSEPQDTPLLQAATKNLRDHIAGIVPRSTLKTLKEIDAQIEKILPPPSNRALEMNGERYLRGVRALNLTGEFGPSETLTAQIFHVIWFAWPMLEKKKNFRASDLGEWVSENFGIHASSKLFEKVYGELGFAGYKTSSL